jgi:hypothetical protein
VLRKRGYKPRSISGFVTCPGGILHRHQSGGHETDTNDVFFLDFLFLVGAIPHLISVTGN